jgi:ADP-ribose pyrophosphatase YjhB (NUDIX family)
VTHKVTLESARSLHPWQRDWLAAFERYATDNPGERAVVSLFTGFAAAHADAAERSLASGHLTGSAWLVSADGKRVLMTLHRKLNRWLQLGGHADGDVDLARVTLREAEEESGLNGLVVEADIFDLDRHEIPARANEPAHWHYDVRYVVRAGADENFVVGDESHALAWCDIAALAADESTDESLRRMARKWLGRA